MRHLCEKRLEARQRCIFTAGVNHSQLGSIELRSAFESHPSLYRAALHLFSRSYIRHGIHAMHPLLSLRISTHPRSLDNDIGRHRPDCHHCRRTIVISGFCGNIRSEILYRSEITFKQTSCFTLSTTWSKGSLSSAPAQQAPSLSMHSSRSASLTSSASLSVGRGQGDAGE